MAGASGRTRRPAQQQVNPAQQVQEFLLSLKMRAMAGDPQAIAILNQYQQIIAPSPGAGQPADLQPPAAPPMQLDLPPPGMAPEGYPPAPMAGEASNHGRQARRQKIQVLKSRAAAGDSEALAALQILRRRTTLLNPHARRSSSNGSFVGFNGHLAFIR
jgi:hypothetical protein